MLDGLDPLLYAAKKAIGHLLLNEEETRNTARRAYENNPRLTSVEIGRAIGRSRQAVDAYITDLRATTEMEMDLIFFRVQRFGIPQDRITKRLGVPQRTLLDHLAKMPSLANPLNTDLAKGFTVPQVAEKYACPVGPEDRTGGWPEPLVWSIALEGKDDLLRFKDLNWELRPVDPWEWTDCLPREIHVNDKQSVFHWGDKRFGDDWPGRLA